MPWSNLGIFLRKACIIGLLNIFEGNQWVGRLLLGLTLLDSTLERECREKKFDSTNIDKPDKWE